MSKADSNYQSKNQRELLLNVHKIYSVDTILPDDAAFFLGYTLYHHQQYKKSKEAFLRYVDLTKEAGRYFDSTQFLVNQVDVLLVQYDTNSCDICGILGPLDIVDTCGTCIGVGHFTNQCSRCSGSGLEVCPRCLGVGYERYLDNFGTNFYPCQLCGRTGVVDCQKCRGTKVEKSLCQTCAGIGTIPRPRDCTHRNLVGAKITPVKKTKTVFYR
jgi:hypothetical protein